jgi:phage antirepressor YoqD-like protein
MQFSQHQVNQAAPRFALSENVARNVKLFNFDGADVRAVLIDGEPLFVAKDVAVALCYANPQKAVRDHCKAARPVGANESFTLDPQTMLIPERDVYRLVMKSHMAAAERFEEWVVGEVLPSIRKTGGYSVAPALPNFSNPADAARAWADQFESRLIAEEALAIAAPKAEFVDRYVAADGSMSFRQVAKLLSANERKFRQMLLDQGVMYYLGGVLTPKAAHIDAGRFEVKTGTSERNQHAFTQARFTAKGVQWVAGLWAASQMEQQV